MGQNNVADDKRIPPAWYGNLLHLKHGVFVNPDDIIAVVDVEHVDEKTKAAAIPLAFKDTDFKTLIMLKSHRDLLSTVSPRTILKKLKFGKLDISTYFAAPKIGQYIYRESIAPEGYILDEGTHIIEIKADGTITGTKFTNTPIIPQTGVTDWTQILIGAVSLLVALLVGFIVFDARKKKRNK